MNWFLTYNPLSREQIRKDIMDKLALSIITFLSLSNPAFGVDGYAETPSAIYAQEKAIEVISEKSISLSKRYDSQFVNDVFKDNILLTLNYLGGEVKKKSDIDWEKVNETKFYSFSIMPGEIFAFHDNVLPEFQNVAKTTNAHFNFEQGFKSDGYLMGDGVCHLASLTYWAAKDAGLNATAPVNHDFAVINEVPKEYGVSIYYLPEKTSASGNQNLYIENNLDKEILFAFTYDGEYLNLQISKLIN